MKKLLFILGLMVPMIANAGPSTMFGMPYPQSGSTTYPVAVNSSGQLTTTLLAGEDQTNGVMKVEMQMTPKFCTADCQVKASAGFVESITCGGTDAAAQAGGVITLYDNTAASGSTYWNYSPAAVNVQPFTNSLKHIMATGIYLDFPASTTDIWCSVSYR